MCKTSDLAREITDFIDSETKTTPGEFVPHNQSIEAVCGDGYRSQGVLTCNAGNWMGNSTCELDVKGCVLKDPGMHFISLGNRTVLNVGENANVSCKFGYQIVPNMCAKRAHESTADISKIPETEDNENFIPISDVNYTCIDDAKWDPEIRFSCKKIICDRFEGYNFENGRIYYSPSNEISADTVAKFVCNNGYVRDGPETRTCQIDGTWSGECVTCQNKARNASSTCPAPCVPVGAIMNGLYPYVINSTANFRCLPSETQDINYRSSIFKCIKNGKNALWNGTMINCKEIICDKGDHYGFENGGVTYSSSVPTVGTKATFTCNPDYKHRGPMIKVCQKDGTWSRGCITCQKHHHNDMCSLSPVNGTLYSDKITGAQVFPGPIASDSQIKVTCYDGFFHNKLHYDVSTCANGVWTPEIVTCEKTGNF